MLNRLWAHAAKALDLRSDEVYTVLEGVTGVQGLAVDANIGVLYFTEMGTPAIMSVSYNGGNATTIHNKNSSRFGKWLSVYFDERGRVAAQL